MEVMQFLKSAGKAFEIIKQLCSAVLQFGGTEDDVLKLLKPEGSVTIDGFAAVLVGASRIVPIPDEDIVERGEACVEVQRRAIERMNSPENAVRVFWENVDRQKGAHTAMALMLIKDQAELRTIAVGNKADHLIPSLTDSVAAARKVFSSKDLLVIATSAPRVAVRVAAVERLKSSLTPKIFLDSTQENLVRVTAIRGCDDPEQLEALQRGCNDECNDFYDVITARLRTIYAIQRERS